MSRHVIRGVSEMWLRTILTILDFLQLVGWVKIRCIRWIWCYVLGRKENGEKSKCVCGNGNEEGYIRGEKGIYAMRKIMVIVGCAICMVYPSMLPKQRLYVSEVGIPYYFSKDLWELFLGHRLLIVCHSFELTFLLRFRWRVALSLRL